MSYEPVDLYIMDDLKNPIEGVVGRILSSDGAKVYSQFSGDTLGHVGLLLVAPGTYQLRFYKFGVSFEPVLITTQEAPATNSFNIYGEPFMWPSSTDARLCVASGYFRDVTGAPKAHQDLQFVADFSPFVLDDSAVASERRSVRTDEKGWVEIPLIRNAIYGVTMEGWTDQFRRVTVPDKPAVNLSHLLFPRVDRIEMETTTPVVLRKGRTVEIPVSAITTDLRVLADINYPLIWTSSAPGVFIISSRTPTSLTLRGEGRGTAELQATRNSYMQGGDAPVYYPDTPLKGVPVQVNVV